MTHIQLQTLIAASPDRCFDLSRSIDLHQSSMKKNNEKAIAGKLSGLIELGESVTWQATHFFIRQKLSSRIIEMKKPEYFIDEMIEGAFLSMWHRHSFQSKGEFTLMTDDFKYEVPYGILGGIFNFCVLKNYMTKILRLRNEEIKRVAESK